MLGGGPVRAHDGRDGRDRRLVAPVHAPVRRHDRVRPRGAVSDGRRHAEALLPLVQALFAEPSPAVLHLLIRTSDADGAGFAGGGRAGARGPRRGIGR